MKKFIAILTVLGIFVCANGISVSVADSGQNVSSEADTKAKKVKFAIEGMMCEESCAASVQKILAGQSGVASVKVNYKAKTATCTLDGSKKFDVKKAIADLDDKDFKATVIE